MFLTLKKIEILFKNVDALSRLSRTQDVAHHLGCINDQDPIAGQNIVQKQILDEPVSEPPAHRPGNEAS